MLVLTFTAIIVAFVTVVVAAVVVAREKGERGRAIERETLRLSTLHDARVDDLLNRLAHAYDKPFETAPADEPEKKPEPDDDEIVTDLSFLGQPTLRDPVMT